MITAVIIDDVKSLRESLMGMLNKHCPQVKILADVENIDKGLLAINELKPSLVFLDIEMPGGTGFDLLSKLNTINFKIIFVTAYEDYAVKAFKFSAVDYLLKPIDKDDLISAVDKAKNILDKENIDVQLQALISNIQVSSKKEIRKLVLKTAEKIYSVNVNDIIRCESFKNYTEFYLNDNKKLLASTTLKEYDDLLSPAGFFRTHQSHLINLQYFDHYVKSDGGMAVLKDGSQIPVSTRKKDDLLKAIDKL